MQKKKIISIILIIILILNLTLFVIRKINQITFWIVIAVIGLIAYKGMKFVKE